LHQSAPFKFLGLDISPRNSGVHVGFLYGAGKTQAANSARYTNLQQNLTRPSIGPI
jgi:hypothetical protein